MNATAPRRFMAKVEKTDGCWLWTGGKSSAGYGTFNMGDDRYDYAHRISYRLHVGPIPQGLVLDHLCSNPACVNPAHLEAVTQRENTRRGFLRLRPTCPRGHVHDAQTKDGHRKCRQCVRERYHERKAA